MKILNFRRGLLNTSPLHVLFVKNAQGLGNKKLWGCALDGLGRVERFRAESDRVKNEKNGNRIEFSRKDKYSGWTTKDIGCGRLKKWVGPHWIAPDI